jgi:tetratricopeptide (TPR) repeat protein
MRPEAAVLENESRRDDSRGELFERPVGRVVAKSMLARVHMMLGRHESAISALEALRNDRQGEAATAWGYVEVGPTLALGYALAGEKQKAERLLEELEREDDGKRRIPC